MQEIFCIKISIIYKNFFLLFMLQIEIIIYYNDRFEIESFDNRLQKLNQYSSYHIKISNRRQFSRRNLKSRNYKHKKNNKVTIYSFHAHEHFWKMRYKQHRLVLIRLQNRQHEIEFQTALTKLQSNFIQKITFFHRVIDRTTNFIDFHINHIIFQIFSIIYYEWKIAA